MEEPQTLSERGAELNRRPLVMAAVFLLGLALGIVVACVWVAWAVSVLPGQMSDAEQAYFLDAQWQGEAPPMWNRPVQIKTARAYPVSVSSVFPPGFTFKVSLEASIGGEPRRDVGTVSFGGDAFFVSAVSFGDESLLEDTRTP